MAATLPLDLYRRRKHPALWAIPTTRMRMREGLITAAPQLLAGHLLATIKQKQHIEPDFKKAKGSKLANQINRRQDKKKSRLPADKKQTSESFPK